METIVNIELYKLSDWLIANKLTLNIKKSNFVIFHPYQKRLDYQIDLKIFDYHSKRHISLERKEYVKYLGILIDSNLTWKYHISHIVCKMSKSIGIIARLRHFVPTTTLINIYNSIILPYISYGIALWGQAADIHINRIFKLQKRALRLIYFGDFTSHAVPYFLSANTLPLRMLYFKSICILMHDISNNLLPTNILNLFNLSKESHEYNTRFSSSNCYQVNYSRS